MADIIWKQIPFAPDYEISEYGVVRRLVSGLGNSSTKGKIIAQCLNGKGYSQLKLAINREVKSFKVHIIVCIVFKGPKPESGYEAAHKDGIKLNNHFSNLMWATPKENSAHKEIHGTMCRGAANGMTTIAVDQVLDVKRRLLTKQSYDFIARKTGVKKSIIVDIKRGRSWNHVQL